MIHRPTFERLSSTAHDLTVKEIALEKAASLGRAGRRLERALHALDAGVTEEGVESPREELLAEAGEAFFFYVVQREACGLRDVEEVIRELRVPPEVQLRMGLRQRP